MKRLHRHNTVTSTGFWGPVSLTGRTRPTGRKVLPLLRISHPTCPFDGSPCSLLPSSSLEGPFSLPHQVCLYVSVPWKQNTQITGSVGGLYKVYHFAHEPVHSSGPRRLLPSPVITTPMEGPIKNNRAPVFRHFLSFLLLHLLETQLALHVCICTLYISRFK